MMNKLFLYIAIVLTALATACESDMDMYSTQTEWLAFRFYSDQDSIARKTFIYDPEEVSSDTIYLPIHLIGWLVDYDRPVSVEQVMVEGEENAVAGVHFVDFNSEEWKPNMVIRANDGEPQISIAVLRDPSLQNGDHILRLKIVANEYFQPWNEKEIYKDIIITEQLTRPEHWFDFYFGVWGPVKHRFLMDTFETLTWDDEFFELLQQDYPYCEYLIGEAQKALDEENQRREEQGLPPLAEEGSLDPIIFKK